MAIFISFDSFDIGYFVQPCNIPSSMQHVVSTPSTYPGSCKTCFSHKPVLIGQYALWSLPTAVLDELFSSLGGYFEIISHSWLLNFIETRHASFNPFDITNWNYSTWSVMPKPVSLLTVQEAHKEYSSLTDQIRAKYKQLDSGEFGSPGTPAFDAEACELANLLARVSQLCQRLNLPMPKELYRPTFFKHWRHFSDQNTGRKSWLGYGGCSFVPIDM